MVKLFRKFVFLLPVILMVFLLSGCGRLKMIDEKLGEMLFDDTKNIENASSTDESVGESGLGFTVSDYKELTKEQKEKIDEFIKEHGLNRYGDPSGIFYTGGTPLFNEATGESIDRFEYILEKHPEFFTQ